MTDDQVVLFVWKCKTCGCLWRDNLNGFVSLFDAQQKSCDACEHNPTNTNCEPHALTFTQQPARAPSGQQYKPQAKRLRDRATMNILTVEEPYPDVTKKIVRQLLSALEAAEREIQHVPSQNEIRFRDLIADGGLPEAQGDPSGHPAASLREPAQDFDAQRLKRISEEVAKHRREGTEESDLDFLWRKLAAASGAVPPQPEWEWTLEQLAKHLGWGVLPAEDVFKFAVERERLLRGVMAELETHRSNAPTAELAIRERINALRAEGGAVPPAPDWQPIETAPKDGTDIILVGFGHGGRTVGDVCHWSEDDYNDLGPSWRFWRFVSISPVLWMPLPKKVSR